MTPSCHSDETFDSDDGCEFFAHRRRHAAVDGAVEQKVMFVKVCRFAALVINGLALAGPGSVATSGAARAQVDISPQALNHYAYCIEQATQFHSGVSQRTRRDLSLPRRSRGRLFQRSRPPPAPVRGSRRRQRDRRLCTAADLGDRILLAQGRGRTPFAGVVLGLRRFHRLLRDAVCAAGSSSSHHKTGLFGCLSHRSTLGSASLKPARAFPPFSSPLAVAAYPRRARRRRAQRSRAGFTLVEMLVVLAIIGMIVGLVGPRVLNYLSEFEGQDRADPDGEHRQRARPVLSRRRTLSHERGRPRRARAASFGPVRPGTALISNPPRPPRIRGATISFTGRRARAAPMMSVRWDRTARKAAMRPCRGRPAPTVDAGDGPRCA